MELFQYCRIFVSSYYLVLAIWYRSKNNNLFIIFREETSDKKIYIVQTIKYIFLVEIVIFYYIIIIDRS